MGIKAIIFDWGDTVMRDFKLDGPMSKWEQVELIPGTRESLKQLSEKYRCIIATSAGHSNAEEMKKSLHRVGVDIFFWNFYASADTGVYKPDPGFYETILKSELLAANEAVAIGNLYEKDVVPAKKAGLYTIFFNEKEEKGNYPMADRVITSMTRLPGAIREI